MDFRLLVSQFWRSSRGHREKWRTSLESAWNSEVCQNWNFSKKYTSNFFSFLEARDLYLKFQKKNWKIWNALFWKIPIRTYLRIKCWLQCRQGRVLPLGHAFSKNILKPWPPMLYNYVVKDIAWGNVTTNTLITSYLLTIVVLLAKILIFSVI